MNASTALPGPSAGALPATDVPLLPQHFRGRRSIVDPVCARLRQPELLSSQVVGGPFSGKTSLLRWLASPYADEALGQAAGTVRVYVDATVLGADATPPQFWRLACRELRQSPAGAALLDVQGELRTTLAAALTRAAAGQLDIFDLQDLFDGFAKLGRPVVLMVNAFDTVIANSHFLPPAEFFNQVRNLCNRSPRGLAFVVGSGRPLSDVGAAAAGPSPPYNHFGTIPMVPLCEDDVRAQLAAWAQAAGVPPSDESAAMVMRLSGGQPLLASHLMHQLVQAWSTGRVLDEAACLALITEPDGPAERLNQSILAALAARELQAVQAWSSDPGSLTDGQRTQLQRLRKFALLPPGIDV